MKIKQKRESAGMTQSYLAKALGIDQSTVCLWETNKTMPRASLLPKIASILNCTVDELLSEDSDKPMVSQHKSDNTDSR